MSRRSPGNPFGSETETSAEHRRQSPPHDRLYHIPYGQGEQCTAHYTVVSARNHISLIWVQFLKMKRTKSET